MDIKVNAEKDRVTIKCTMAEAEEVLAALRAQKQAKAVPPAEVPLHLRPVWVLMVQSDTTTGLSYKTEIWFDEFGNKRSRCECGDNKYRRRFCKHLHYSDMVRQHDMFERVIHG